MKNTFKLLGIIVLLAVTGFSMASCTGGGGKSFNSANDLMAYLNKQPANGPDKPIRVTMNANAPMLEKIAEAINESGKYVSLNITGAALKEIPDWAFEGCDTLVSINIPASVTEIGREAFADCDSLASIKFEGAVRFFNDSLPGDLFTKLQAGGIGTYTTERPGYFSTWTKQ